MKRVDIYAESRNFGRTIVVHIEGRAAPSSTVIERATPLAYAMADRESVCEPTIEMHINDAQQLVDALWRVGIRPTENRDNPSALAAKEAHLADMRRLVFETEKP